MISQLPSPPKGKKGWPWTQESKPLPPTMPDGSAWPKISIVTPSYNQGRFIEETIRSVLLQNYPNLEYLIIDGGSTDETVEIIKKYEPWLTYWVSEPDRGQSHAINKGFERCTGDIYNWLCSDDVLLENTFIKIAEIMELSGPFWIIGNAYSLTEQTGIKRKIKSIKNFGVDNLLQWSDLAVHQPSIFWNKELHEAAFHINHGLKYCMDVDLWFKFYLKRKPFITNFYFSVARHHNQAKTTNFSLTYNDYLLEFAQWKIENIYKSKNTEIIKEAKESTALIHKQLREFKKLKNDKVISGFVKGWTHFLSALRWIYIVGKRFLMQYA